MFLSQKYLFFLAEKIGGISGFILPPFEENVYGEKAFPYLGFPSFTEKSAKQYLKGSLKCILRSVRIFVTPSERVDTIIRNLIVWRNSVLWVRRFQLGQYGNQFQFHEIHHFHGHLVTWAKRMQNVFRK